MFFFLTQFLQSVRGYTPLAAGLAFVPLASLILVASGIAAKFLPRFGPRALTAAGGAAITGGLVWFARLDPGSGYAGALLGPMLLSGIGMGVLLVGAVRTDTSPGELFTLIAAAAWATENAPAESARLVKVVIDGLRITA